MRTMFGLALGLSGLVLGLAGCGGSGDPPPGASTPSVALLSGAYRYFALRGESGPPEFGEVRWGTGDADGAGGLTVAFSSNSEGALGSVGPQSLTYTVDADRALEWQVAGIAGARGRLSADGRLAALATTGAGATPSVQFLLRRDGTFGPASLSGSFRLLGFLRSPAIGSYGSLTGDVVIDGSGALSGSVTENVEGTVTTGLPFTATLSVAPDGTLTGSAFGAGLSGGLAPDGRFAALGGGTGAGDDPVLLVLLR